MSSARPNAAAPARSALALAERAYELVQVSPRRAQAHAERAFALAGSERDAAAQVAALHALSWAQHVQGDPRTFATAKAGIRIAERSGEHRRAALLRRRLALSLADAGKTRAAEQEIDAAIAELTGRERARSEVFRIAIQRNAYGAAPEREGAILAASRRAVEQLRGPEDAVWRARIFYNRGVLLWERGEESAAERDLRRAFELYEEVGAKAAAIDTAAVLAGVELVQGDVIGCLDRIDRIRRTLPAGYAGFNLESTEAQALAQARLVPEAEAAIQRHLDHWRAGRVMFAAATLLELAAMSVAAGRTATALEISRRLTRIYAARRSRVGVARACAVRLRAQVAARDSRASALRTGLRAASALAEAGSRREELRLRAVLVRVALDTGSLRQARKQLALAEPLLRLGTGADRIEFLHARALVAAADGSPAAARRSLRRGLRLLDDYRAAFGAADIRVTASGLGSELSELGLRLALEGGRPAEVLDWAEQARANALRLPHVRPQHDRRLRGRLAELRRTAVRLRDVEGSARELGARQVALEAEVRAITRRARGASGAQRELPTRGAAVRALGDSALVEYVELDGVLRALTLNRGRLSLHELGPFDAGELEWLRFSLGRIARRAGSAAQRAGALASADAAAAALDRLLVLPLLPFVGDAPLVLVPTGPLHAVPWAALPSVRGRACVVAPSLSIWLDLARRRSSGRRRIALVAGPGLPHASREIALLADLYGRAAPLTGKAAGAAPVLRAVDGAGVAHVACHGRFRADSPLFSSLELADGPLNVYDLQRLRRPPEMLVLSACDLALSDRYPGDELLGMAAVLLGMGTRTIVASVVPVADSVTRRLMLAFHRQLVAGVRPAVALAHAQASLRGDSAAAAGFVCLGSG
jgi:tetratricopeptide (TPR) repeat protein